MNPQTLVKQLIDGKADVVSKSLHLVDDQVGRYLDDRSPVRKLVRRVVADVDGLLCRQRPDGGGSPIRTQATTPEREPAVGAPVEADEGDDRRVPPEEVEQIDRLTNDLLEQEQTETFAGELAEDQALRRVQAELQAKRLVEEQEEER